VKWVKSLLWMAVFFFAIHFSIQNRDEVVLQYSFHHFRYETERVPLFLIIFCSVFLGVLLGGIADLYGRLQLKKAIRRNEKRIEKLERETESLRTDPTPPCR
jgi:uncharacterized integral membrane protein